MNELLQRLNELENDIVLARVQIFDMLEELKIVSNFYGL